MCTCWVGRSDFSLPAVVALHKPQAFGLMPPTARARTLTNARVPVPVRPQSFAGFASFARVLGDAGPEGEQMLREHNIVEAPTFLFFRCAPEMEGRAGQGRPGRGTDLLAPPGVGGPPASI